MNKPKLASLLIVFIVSVVAIAWIHTQKSFSMWNKQTFSIETDGLSAIIGGEITTVMGAVVIDLVSAPITPGTYDIRLNAVMGGIQLFLPAYARVQVNGETFWAFMRQLETASQETGRRVIVIIDNAKYHHAKLHAAWRLEQQERFCLDFLPPYSPELNPIERVWKRTRRNCLHNVYFPRLALVTETVEKQFARWSKPNAELAALCQLLSAINYGVEYSYGHAPKRVA